MCPLRGNARTIKAIGGAAMIGAKVQMSRETEKQYMIDQLNRLGIYETVKSEPLERVSYYTLRSMLAAARAVAK